jgi:hypothetical protein
MVLVVGIKILPVVGLGGEKANVHGCALNLRAAKGTLILTTHSRTNNFLGVPLFFKIVLHSKSLNKYPF